MAGHNRIPLNPQQEEAVRTTEGRVLILAGAGSGKTSVISHRIAHLIQDKNVQPSAILGLTFTNKAAAEMRQRVGKLIDPKLAKGVTLGTFHSFCMTVLRKEIQRLGYTPHFSLYDENDVKRLTSQLARHLLEHEGDLPSLEPTIALIAKAKCRSADFGKTWHDKFASDLFERLQICMRAYNAVDFDSLLSLTVQLFEEHPDALAAYQDRFRYIMIDEYQDTNPIQDRLAALLSEKHNNLCVVGDDDQSIYSWRGAEIKHILRFEASFVVKLEQNFRSTPIILQAANAVIRHNVERHAKELWSTEKNEEPIVLFHAPTDLEEAQSVMQRMLTLRREKNLQWKDMAILYRSNVLSKAFETALMQTAWQKDGNWVRGIPYRIFGGTEFFERSEIKDLLAFLKAIANPLDQEALLRIINVPRRGISDQALDILTQFNRNKKISLWEVIKGIKEGKEDFAECQKLLSDRALKGVSSFVEILEEASIQFQKPPLHQALTSFLEKIDYKKAIFEEVKSDKMRELKWENVLHCIDTLKQYEDEMEKEGTQGEISLHHFLSITMLDVEKPFYNEKNLSEDKVTLMTFHSAKGLEFTACFLVGLEDHIIPHEKSVSERGVEEERRLMYVAMTRAKKHLILSMARNRKRMGKDMNSQPSRFLFEIPKELVKVSSWKMAE